MKKVQRGLEIKKERKKAQGGGREGEKTYVNSKALNGNNFFFHFHDDFFPLRSFHTDLQKKKKKGGKSLKVCLYAHMGHVV